MGRRLTEARYGEIKAIFQHLAKPKSAQEAHLAWANWMRVSPGIVRELIMHIEEGIDMGHRPDPPPPPPRDPPTMHDDVLKGVKSYVGIRPQAKREMYEARLKHLTEMMADLSRVLSGLKDDPLMQGGNERETEYQIIGSKDVE